MIDNNEYQEQNPSAYMSPMQQYGTSSILLLTNPENELNRMELTFRSMQLNKDGIPISTGQPLMNDYGINAIIGIVQSLVNQITVMSNLNKNEIPILIDFLGDTLARDLMVNRAAYDIKTFAARDKIYFTAISTAFVTLKRGYEEGDRRFWKGSQHEIRNIIEQDKKQGAMKSMMNMWK